jgi:hypothetical protein
MAHTADFCRIQEAAERKRADGATLENVRVIASRAAAAWAREAALAENRQTKRASEVSTLPEAESTSEELDDLLSAETADHDPER